MLSRILVPMDDSEPAGRALEYALDSHSDAEVTRRFLVGNVAETVSKRAQVPVTIVR